MYILYVIYGIIYNWLMLIKKWHELLIWSIVSQLTSILYKTDSREEIIKGTVSVILSDPPCKDGNIRFTTVLFQPLTVQRGQNISQISFEFP